MEYFRFTNNRFIIASRKMFGRFSYILIFPFLFIRITGFSQESPTQAQEYDLKAVYIYNITKFIYWEPTSPGNVFIIGVLGSSPIYEPLIDVVKTKTVNNKKIILRQYTAVEGINNCNMLFIPENSTVSLDEILEKATSEKILTISEQEGYGKRGTAINFVTVNDKLKFEVNIKTLESIGLKASAQFLKLTIIIEE
ncbi:MAG TPA: YfiR family protein [Prolixibacteraceae bacterium]|nr:YfiR family protein [Prolixibacteraceae bacterium]